jgi:hypothetical protein
MDPLGRFHAIEIGHGDVENGHVQRGRLCLLHSFAAVRSFRSDGEAGLCLKQQPKPSAHHNVVIG